MWFKDLGSLSPPHQASQITFASLSLSSSRSSWFFPLARYSVTRSTTVSHHDDSDRFHCVSNILPDAFPVYKLSGAQHSNPRCRNSASLAHNCADLSALCRSFGAISSSQHSCIKSRVYAYRTTTPLLSTT
jgi:hypothetical protein